MSDESAPAPAAVQTPRAPRLWKRRLRILCYGAIVLYVGSRLAQAFLPVRIEVGPETTGVVGPMAADGTIDLAGALNEELSRGVTIDNNAAVLLVGVSGPTLFHERHREQYCRILGIDVPPADGNYLIALRIFAAAHGLRLRALPIIYSSNSNDFHPFTADFDPTVSAWLEASRAPLDLAVEASRRARCYSPIVSAAGESLADSQNEHPLRCGLIASALMYRAMLRLGDRDIVGACEDTLACHRLARLIAEQPFVVTATTASAVDTMATAGSERIVLSGQLTPELAKRYRAEIESLSPYPDFSRSIELARRFLALDIAQRITHGQQPALGKPVPQLVMGSIDPNILCRMFNETHNRILRTMEIENREQRAESQESLATDLQTLSSSDLNDPYTMVRMLCVDRRSTVTRQVGESLMSSWIPPFRELRTLEDATAMRTEVIKVCWAIGEFRAVEGRFPESLAELVPDYLPQIPTDLFDGHPLKYIRTGKGFLVYSVGPDGSDNHGSRGDIREDIVMGAKSP